LVDHKKILLHDTLIPYNTLSQKALHEITCFAKTFDECMLIFEKPTFGNFIIINPFANIAISTKSEQFSHDFLPEDKKNNQNSYNFISKQSKAFTSQDIDQDNISERKIIDKKKSSSDDSENTNDLLEHPIDTDNIGTQESNRQKEYQTISQHSQVPKHALSIERPIKKVDQNLDPENPIAMNNISYENSKKSDEPNNRNFYQEKPYFFTDVLLNNNLISSDLNKLINVSKDNYKFFGDQLQSVPYYNSEHMVEIEGFREKGGKVEAGKNYIVGEKGPELLMMKNAPGTVIPSDKITNNQNFSVIFENIQINTSGENDKEYIKRQIKQALDELAENEFRAETGVIRD